MQRQKLIDQMCETNKERMELMSSKGHDYANEDALSNFKRVQLICKIWDIDPRRSPAECAFFLAILKQDRWHNLRSKGSPQNESILDTLKDLLNYFELAYACDTESLSEVVEDTDSCCAT